MPEKPQVSTLVAEIAEAIERGIMDGRYLPGTQLVEREIAEDLGVSRIPLREAFRLLASQHILEIRPYRSAIVKKLTRKEALDIIEILRALGAVAVSQAAARIDEADNMKRLNAIVADERLTKDREKMVKDWISVNHPFYQLIGEISGNPMLRDLLRQVQMHMYRLVSHAYFTGALKTATVDDHLAIADAILAGDSRKAVKAYETHVKHTLDAIAAIPDSVFASKSEKLRKKR